MLESEARMELARARAGVDGRGRSHWPKRTKPQLGGRNKHKRSIVPHGDYMIYRKVYTLENNRAPTSKKGLCCFT